MRGTRVRLLIVATVIVGALALAVWRGPSLRLLQDAFAAVAWEWIAAGLILNLLSVIVRVLAWRFVIWALNTGGPAVQRRIQRELATVAETTASSPPSPHASFDGASHGLLSAEQRTEIRAAALREVVLPCARELLGAEQRSEPLAATV